MHNSTNDFSTSVSSWVTSLWKIKVQVDCPFSSLCSNPSCLIIPRIAWWCWRYEESTGKSEKLSDLYRFQYQGGICLKRKGDGVFSGYFQLEYKELQKLLKKTLGGGILQVAFQLEYKKLQKLLGKKLGGGNFLQVTLSIWI